METRLAHTGERKMGFFSRLGGLFTSPGEVFSALKKRTDFWWPIIFILFTMAFSYPISQVSMRLISETDPGYAEIVGKMGEKSLVFAISGLIGALVTVLLAWFLRTVVFTLAAKALGGESVPFATVFSVLGYTCLPQSLRQVFQGTAAMFFGIIPPVGLDMMIDSHESSAFLRVVLAEINPFTVFYLILTTIALEKLFRLSRGKSLLITFVSWAVVLGFALISARFYPSSI